MYRPVVSLDGSSARVNSEDGESNNDAERISESESTERRKQVRSVVDSEERDSDLRGADSASGRECVRG